MKTGLLLLIALSLSPVFAPAAAQSLPSYLERASGAAQELENWYHWSPCFWYEPWTWGQLCQAGTWQRTLGWGWWDSANALTNTIDYTALSGDTSYLDLIQNGFVHRHDPDYIARNFTDDEGWWALAWIDAYDLKSLRDRYPDSKYLERAIFIFNDMAKYWDAQCGGGIWWQKKPKSYKNAIANEIFMTIAAKLFRRTGDSSYLRWAKAESRWFFGQSKLWSSGKLIVDGLDNKSCTPAGGTQATWTYNQGVILGALVELEQWDLAKSIANAVLESPQLVTQGVLTEWNENAPGGCAGGDCPQFKGIFMRGLGVLERALPDSDPAKSSYQQFIRQNADSLWVNDRVDHLGLPRFGVRWGGPVQGTLNAATQTSALAALVAAIGL